MQKRLTYENLQSQYKRGETSIFISTKKQGEVKSHNVNVNDCTGKHTIVLIEEFENGEVHISINNESTEEDWILEIFRSDKGEIKFYPLCVHEPDKGINEKDNSYFSLECILHPCNNGQWTDEENRILNDWFKSNKSLSVLKSKIFTRNNNQIRSKLQKAKRKRDDKKVTEKAKRKRKSDDKKVTEKAKRKRSTSKAEFPLIPQYEIPQYEIPKLKYQGPARFP
jgi:hypothetical protein